jgi:hypothetical protein
MPIRGFLTRPHAFDDEAIRVMGIAFECARSALRISADDPLSAEVAMKIIELAQSGERDSEKLCDFAIEGLLPPRAA